MVRYPAGDRVPQAIRRDLHADRIGQNPRVARRRYPVRRSNRDADGNEGLAGPG